MKSIVPVSVVATCLLATGILIGCDKSPSASDHIVGPSLVAAGPVTQLAFTVQPSNAAAGAAITPAVQVTAQDAQGNTVTTYTAKVTVALVTNPSGAKLGGTVTVSPKSGVATFSNLSITKAAAGYALRATSGTLTAATSSPFDIAPGPTSKIMFTVQPAPTAAGDPITPAVAVSAEDAFNNVATTYSGSVSLALRSCPAGAVLSGTSTASVQNGVATFADLSINKSGNCSLKATSGSFTATSVTFVIGPAAPVSLKFLIQPSKTKAGVAITQAVKVTARDRFDNTASGFNGDVTMSIASGPAGSILLGTTTVTAVSGTATFANLILQKVGSYTLQASATGLTGATSNGFLIVPNSPTHLAFTVQPSTTAPGAVITPSVQVTVRDAYDNPVPITGGVTVAIGSNPGGGTLSGTLTRSAAATGVATFDDLSINNPGTGYMLVATLGTLPSATSASFDISSPATHLAFTVQPSTTAAGATITPAVQVTALDAQGTRATSFTGGVTVAIESNPGGGTLSGTTTVTAISGVATFSTLTIDKAGNGYTLQASSSGITGATSAPFNVTIPAVPHLVFTVQPTTTPNAATMNPWVRVSAVDGNGDLVTSFSDFVTLSIGTNPGGGTLYGSSARADQGIAIFNSVIFDGPGNGYTLVASASGFASVTSAPFDITNFPTRLSNNNGRLRAPQGQTIAPPIQFTVVDQHGVVDASFNSVVTLSLGDNPFGGVLSGTTALTASAGVVTFSDVSISKPGTYEVFASSPGVTRGFVSNVEISGPPKYLSFLGNINPTMAGTTITPPVQVFAYDSNGTQTKDFVGTVTVAIGTNPGGGTLSGTTAVVADTGVATFSDLSIDQSGTGYTLQASSAGLVATVSPSFDITGSSGATHLVFSVQPTTTVVNRPITPAVEITVKDDQENTVTGFVNQVHISNGRCNDPTCDLNGTTDATPVNGVATFSDLSVGQTENFSLGASATGLPTVTSVPFNITAPDGGDSWTPKRQMPTPRDYLAVGVVNGILYAVGGGAGLGTLEAYDPATDTWATNLPAMPTPRTGLGVAVINGIVYAGGGSSSTGFLGTIEAYDPATNTWETDLPPMPTPRNTLGVAAINGILYAVGGNNESGSLNTLEAYDPVAKTWDTTLPPMPTARSSLGVAVIDDTLYAIGGDQLSTVEAYDPVTKTWTSKATLNTSRDAGAVAVVNGTIYAVGGGVSGDYGDGAVEAYNHVTNAWSRKAPLLTARAALAVGVVNGILYAVGGSQGPSKNEAYQP